jgi:hypothetical protein
VQSCSAGFGDCNGTATDGCETSLLTSTANCGACGHSCLFPGSTCSNGFCSTVSLYSSDNLVTGPVVDATSVYFADNMVGILKVPLNGGTPTTLVPGAIPAQFVVDSTFLYWADPNAFPPTVSKMPLTGGTIVALATNPSLPVSVAVDANNVYFADELLGVFQIGLSNFVQTPLFQSNGQRIIQVAADSTSVYFSNFDAESISKVPIGGGATTPLVSGGNTQGTFVLDAKNIYMTTFTNQSVVQMPKAGGSPITLASMTVGLPCGIAVDAANVYWVDEGAGGSGRPGRGVFKAPIGGGTVTTLVPSDPGEPCGIAVDATAVYYTGSDGTGVLKVAK